MKFTYILPAVTILAGCLLGQSVTDVDGLQQMATSNTTIVLTIIASQGDGTVCRFVKVAGGGITLAMACVSTDGKSTFSLPILRSSAAATFALPFAFADVICMIGVNPTAAAATMGSLGNIPATGVGWTCTTNIRTSGTITGQTAVVRGSVAWP